jgi:T-complex protein 1 subunit delta
LSKSQDIEAGDGTTSVVIIAGSLLNGCQKLLDKGIHPTVISEAFGKCSEKAVEILEGMAIKLDLSDKKPLIKAARTSLNSKIISQYSDTLGPLVVDAVYSVIDPKTATNVDLNDIKVVKKIGSTLDKTELVDGLVFPQSVTKSSGGPTKMQNAKIGLIQFCLSPPKTDVIIFYNFRWTVT